MAKIFSVAARAGLAWVVEPTARALLRVGVSPDAVTIAGTIGVLVGAIGFGARGHFITALIIVTLSALTDMLDGTMARALGRERPFGAFLDSTMDRIADGAIFGSVAYWLAVHGHRSGAVAALLCLVLGQVVSYVKARAEGLGLTANVGIAERPERLVMIGIGGLLHGVGVPYALEITLWVLAALSLITVGQRMLHVYRQAERGATP
ncbi:MAG TPA: CDP-alcohol phosphatidyltransferase family protein [Micromonosporaceae bacterium]|nr:CDP-alcohol phosphatidyltransferase family protein [Micromonosporaceae bacterium]